MPAFADKMINQFFIRADSTCQMGTGHIMRCIAFGQWCKTKGARIVFLSYCENNNLRQRIIDEDFEFISIKRPHPDPSDLEKTLLALSSNGFKNWIIVDGYHFSAEYQKTIRDKGHKLLIIDDMVNHPCYYANILLNQNIHAPELKYHSDPEMIQLLGGKYVLLRQEFLQYSDFQKKTPKKATNILVTLGGSDVDNATLKVIKALNLLNESRIWVKIIVGPANPNMSSLKNELNHCTYKYEILSSITNMPKCIAWSDIAISAGGITCWELCYLGVPFLIVILSENQIPIAEGLDKKGIAINMGWHNTMTVLDLANQIFDLKENISKRKQMTVAGKKLIDGHGNKRIYDLINLLNDNKGIKKYIRRAQEKDCLKLFTLSNDPFVRKNSFSSNEINFDDHKKWFDSKLESKESCIFIAEVSNILIGQIRYDKKEDMALISISISHPFRGLGFGCRMIESTFKLAGKELSVNKICAVVKNSNLASIHAFIKAGFRKIDETFVFGTRSQIFEKMI